MVAPNAAAYRNAVLASKPVGFWPFDDPVGSLQAADASGGNRPASLNQGTVTFGAIGPFSDASALEFNGGVMFTDPSPPVGLTHASIEGWARTSWNGEGQMGLTTWAVGGPPTFAFYWWGGGLGVNWPYQFSAPWWTGDTSPVAYDTWFHFAMTLAGYTVRVYLNGTEHTAFTDTSIDLPIEYVVWGRPDWPSVHTRQALSAVYDRALTAQEVSDHYNGIGPEPPVEPTAKVWNGSTWVPAAPKGFDGAQWRPAKVFTGSKWV